MFVNWSLWKTYGISRGAYRPLPRLRLARRTPTPPLPRRAPPRTARPAPVMVQSFLFEVNLPPFGVREDE